MWKLPLLNGSSYPKFPHQLSDIIHCWFDFDNNAQTKWKYNSSIVVLIQLICPCKYRLFPLRIIRNITSSCKKVFSWSIIVGQKSKKIIVNFVLTKFDKSSYQSNVIDGIIIIDVKRRSTHDTSTDPSNQVMKKGWEKWLRVNRLKGERPKECGKGRFVFPFF